MTKELTIKFPFEPRIIQAYGDDGQIWSWMSEKIETDKEKLDKIRKKSPECDALISFLKAFGACDKEILEHIKIRSENV